VLTAGAFTSQSVTRQEVGNTTFRMFLRWNPHEFLESIQFKYVSVGRNAQRDAEPAPLHGRHRYGARHDRQSSLQTASSR
jgi:hypothetical protein